MTIFFKCLTPDDKEDNLKTAISAFRAGSDAKNMFVCDAADFSLIDGAPFLYFVPSGLLQLVRNGKRLGSSGYRVRKGNGVSVRFHRLHWEISEDSALSSNWPLFVHGTGRAPFYKPSYFRMNWTADGAEAKAEVLHKYPYLNGNAGFVIQGEDFYGKPGLCYGKRTDIFSAQVLPRGHQFTFEGNAIEQTSDLIDQWEMLALLNSRVVSFWLSAVCAQHKYPNYVEGVPIPQSRSDRLSHLARRGWALKRKLDTTNEISCAFLLPDAVRWRVGVFDRTIIASELEAIEAEIDEIAVGLYGLSEEDLLTIAKPVGGETEGEAEAESESENNEEVGDDIQEMLADSQPALFSWAVGVAFGRFDWSLATGEREAPPEPDPFDPLPAKSPAMLLDGADPFHEHAGVLVDDPCHPHDLTRLVEAVLERIDCPVPIDVRHWLQRDFFPFHLQGYSKGRRKAPIYWPLSTVSGGYTLWLYYPSLTSQTLFRAVNDFVEPKLKQIGEDLAALRNKGSERSRDDEKTLEALQGLELELIEFRDALLAIAPTYRPNQDDGVQITAAPLWALFQHKPWQKILKDTWTKLEKGEYDWAHLAMRYWPERVREKCKTDKSLAIAHGLEELYIEPAPKPKKIRARKKAGGRK